MHKSEITAVFLAAILFTGALTAAIPTFIGDAEASSDKRDKKDRDKDRHYDEYKDYGYEDKKYGYEDKKDYGYEDKKYGYEDKKDYGYEDKEPKKYYDKSSAYGQEYYKKPAYGTDYNYDNDKKVIKKIIIVCPDGSKVPVNGDSGDMQANSFMNGGMNSNGGENGLIKKFCPDVDNGLLGCENCFANAASLVPEDIAVEAVNLIVSILDAEGEVLEPVDNVDGLTGSYFWQICEELARQLDNPGPGQDKADVLTEIISDVAETQETGASEEATSVALYILLCIAEREGIEIDIEEPEPETPEVPITGNIGGLIPGLDLGLN
jgi:hypothetical protein